MNTKRALRIAKKQPWYEAFKKNVISQYGDFESFVKVLSAGFPVEHVLQGAFDWDRTKEGYDYWKKTAENFKKQYYDDSIKIFTREAYGKTPVAKLIDAAVDDEPRFVSALKDTGICYDSIESEGMDLVAYKNSYKIVEEWM